MSLKEIELPPRIIADLYKKSLVELSPNKHPPDAQVSIPNTINLAFLGKNQRNVLIFVDYPREKYLPAGQLEFLVNILKACQLNLDDIAIVNLGQPHPDFAGIRKQLQPSSILLFGIDGSPIPLTQFTHFVISGLEGAQVVSVPELEKLNQQTTESKVLKTKLWNNLKQLFNV